MRAIFLLFSLFVMSTVSFAEPYVAPFWLPGGDLQTLHAVLFESNPSLEYRRERWELPDGDFVDTDWVEPENAESSQPIVVLFHGLEGNSQSHYAKAVMAATLAKGWRGVVIHFRGCSGELNRLPRVYYAGDTTEIEQHLSRVRSLFSNAPIYTVGFSLGGNALLKWLGKSGSQAKHLINRAIAVSAPIDLAATANSLDTGLNRYLYTPYFVDSMRPKALAMLEKFPEIMNEKDIKSAKTIHDIDNAVTAVLYGASDAEDYYAKNASKGVLKGIQIPTLILNAKNDPFVPLESLPTSAEVSSIVTLEYPDTGGHVGFSGRENWLARRVLEFFTMDAN